MSAHAAIAVVEASQLDAEIEALEGVLQRLRAMREAVAQPAIDEPAAPVHSRPERLLTEDWIELGEAAKRFGTRKDTLRNWCRVHGVGFKDGGRWLVSIRKVQERIDR